MNMIKWFFAVNLVFSLSGFPTEGEGPCGHLGRQWKNSVVNIDLSIPIGLARDASEGSGGTGFVVDADRGIIVTNQHISTESPTSKINIFFNNGEMTSAKVMYYDPWHDFAFFQYDPKSLRFRPKSVDFGSITDVREGETMCLMGNSSSEQFSVKSGNVNRVFVSKSPQDIGRHSHHIHLSLARAGGASGSPVFTTRGKVVGIHTSGKDNESFELRIDYVKDALEEIRRGGTPKRGDLYLSLYAVRVQRGPDYMGFDAKKYDPPKSPGWPRKDMLFVDLLAPGSEAAKKLTQGDVVLGIRSEKEKNYRMIGDDLYAFDSIVNQNVGRKVGLLLFRDGKEIQVELLVHDAEAGKVRRFAIFSGGVFHDLTTSLALNLDRPLNSGVFLSQASGGSPFEIGKLVKDTTNKRRVIIDKVGSVLVHNLEEFIREMKKIQKPTPTMLWLQDLYGSGIRYWAFTDPDPTFEPLKVFHWDAKALAWVQEAI